MVENTELKEELKKEFDDLQRMFREFVADSQDISLKELIQDNITVYDCTIRKKVMENEEMYKKCKRLLKKMNRVKNKNDLTALNMEEEMKKLLFYKKVETPTVKVSFVPELDFLDLVERMNKVNNLPTNMDPASVKEDIQYLRKIPEFSFKECTLTRNLTPSNSHGHVYKKFDLLNQNPLESSQKKPNFQNSLSLQSNLQDSPPNANKLFFNNSVCDKNKKELFK